jgi:hypothetical protein
MLHPHGKSQKQQGSTEQIKNFPKFQKASSQEPETSPTRVQFHQDQTIKDYWLEVSATA